MPEVKDSLRRNREMLLGSLARSEDKEAFQKDIDAILESKESAHP